MSDTSLVPATQARLAQLTRGPMADAEINSTYRLAQILAASGIYPDARDAERAFAKLAIGRALGISEPEALSLYVMPDGGIEAPYPLLAKFVRIREGYDYRPAWIKQDAEGNREAVWCDEDRVEDVRPIVGASLLFTVDGEKRGVSTWTVEDSELAGLTADRGRAKSNHVRYPRNMYLARAMSNGIKWYVPEVASGIPVYSPGEIERTPNLAEGEGGGAEPGWQLSIQQSAAAERVIRRAKALGHAGYMNRATWQMRLNGQPEDFVTKTLNAANAELDELKAALSADPATPEEDAVADGGTGSPEPAAAASETEGSTRDEQAGPDPVSSSEDVSPEPSPQDVSPEDVQGVLMCPVCGQPWDEHSDEQRTECNATADMS